MRIAALRYILRARAWTPWELRSALGMTTAQAYAAWARKNQAEVLTDELPDGARLHWVGPRMEDRVLLYFHSTYSIFFPALECIESGWGHGFIKAEGMFFRP
jgi:hypothetical protein